MSIITMWNTNHFQNAIVHIDGDAFFASCEQSLCPKYRGKPVVTGKERGIAASLSYEAKAMGVKRGMRLFEVRRVCPDAIILPNNYETYSLYSKRMFDIMRRFTTRVEEYSIDEGFCDITGMQRPLHRSYEAIAKTMKEGIQKELGITVSVGLSSSKSLAKLASKAQKPDGFTVLFRKNAEQHLSHIPVDAIWGVGQNTAAHMMHLGIYKAIDFIHKPFEFIQRHFTKPHQEVWKELQGERVYEVDPMPKTSYASISKTKTFTPASEYKPLVFSQLCKNLENACIKLRRHSLVAKKIMIFLKSQKFEYFQMLAQLNRASAFPHDFLPVVEEMFLAVFSENRSYRATGVIVSDIGENRNIQMSLFNPVVQVERMQRVYHACDALSAKFGKHTVHLGGSLLTMKGAQHQGSRGESSWRHQTKFRGENIRQRIGIPLLVHS